MEPQTSQAAKLFDGAAVADVGEHHGLLHGPRVVAAHEADEAIVTVSAAYRMSNVHWLGFDE